MKYMIQVCLQPGPRGVSSDNMFRAIEPFIDEMESFYKGQPLYLNGQDQPAETVWAILFNVVCDSPALRALLGLSGHTSYYLCTLCDIKFDDESYGKRSFAKFEVESYPRRNNQDHKKYGQEWLNATSDTRRKEIVTNHGYRLTFYFSHRDVCL
jgi:hypothetical protein